MSQTNQHQVRQHLDIVVILKFTAKTKLNSSGFAFIDIVIAHPVVNLVIDIGQKSDPHTLSVNTDDEGGIIVA